MTNHAALFSRSSILISCSFDREPRVFAGAVPEKERQRRRTAEQQRCLAGRRIATVGN